MKEEPSLLVADGKLPDAFLDILQVAHHCHLPKEKE